MQKNFSPVPKARKHLRPNLEKFRCSSASLTQKELIKTEGPSDSELHSFSLSFLKIIQLHLPFFQLPFSKNLPTSLLAGLSDALGKISAKAGQDFNEKYQTQEESLQRASKNLMKYEELLQSKAKILEETMKNWQMTKESEINQIQFEKSELIQSKLALEKELRNALTVLQEKEASIERHLKDVEMLQSALYQEKIKGEEMNWKIESQKEKLKEQEAILALKEKLLIEDKKEVINEKSFIENQKMVNELIAGELVKSKSKEATSRRPLSCLTDPWSGCLTPVKSAVPSINEPADLNFTVDKGTFVNIMNSKSVLSRLYIDLNELSKNIFPDLRQKGENTEKIINALKTLKKNTEETLSNFTKKLEEFNEKDLKINELLAVVQDKNHELELKEEQLRNKEICLKEKWEDLEGVQQKFADEVEDFQKEKLEFYEDLTSERKKIEEYYSEFEKKVSVFDKRIGNK